MRTEIYSPIGQVVLKFPALPSLSLQILIVSAPWKVIWRTCMFITGTKGVSGVGEIIITNSGLVWLQLVFHFFPLESWSPELDGETEPSRPEGGKLTYERDFLLQFQSNPLCQIKPEGLPDLEVVLGQARTPSKSGFSQNRYFIKQDVLLSLLYFQSVHESFEN